MDGEVVVFDATGKPDFQALQRRAHLQNEHDVARASVASPATLMAFDLLAIEGHDIRSLPFAERKKLLREVAPTLGPIK